MNKDGKKKFIPALRYDWLTSLYDALCRLTIPEAKIKVRLIEQAEIKAGQHVLDIGCGTGTLLILLKRRHHDAMAWGLDADRRIIAIAKEKAAAEKVPIAFHRGLSTGLSYPDATMDRVISSLFFHHLNRGEKLKTFRETYRVLRPGGEIHIADWGRPQNPAMRLAFFMVQLLDGFETTADNVRGQLPDLLVSAGFEDVREGSRFQTVFGTLAFYSGRKPLKKERS